MKEERRLEKLHLKKREAKKKAGRICCEKKVSKRLSKTMTKNDASRTAMDECKPGYQKKLEKERKALVKKNISAKKKTSETQPSDFFTTWNKIDRQLDDISHQLAPSQNPSRPEILKLLEQATTIMKKKKMLFDPKDEVDKRTLTRIDAKIKNIMEKAKVLLKKK